MHDDGPDWRWIQAQKACMLQAAAKIVFGYRYVMVLIGEVLL